MPLAAGLTKFTTASPLIASFDWLDFATGAGYKSFYFLGIRDSTGNKYKLTQNSSISSASNNNYISTSSDVDFDLTFNNTITIANAEATITYFVDISSSGGIGIVWTVYHVDGKTSAETSLGTVTDESMGAAEDAKQTLILTLARKVFKRGDILRVNSVITSDTAAKFWFSPAGETSLVAENTTTYTNSSSIDIPFEIQS